MENQKPYARFKQTLQDRYGISVTAIREAPRGFAGETYFVETENGPSRFLKLMRNPRRQAFFLHGLRVTDALRAEGIGFVPALIRTTDGQHSIELDGAPAVGAAPRPRPPHQIGGINPGLSDRLAAAAFAPLGEPGLTLKACWLTHVKGPDERQWHLRARPGSKSPPQRCCCPHGTFRIRVPRPAYNRTSGTIPGRCARANGE